MKTQRREDREEELFAVPEQVGLLQIPQMGILFCAIGAICGSIAGAELGSVSPWRKGCCGPGQAQSSIDCEGQLG